MPTIDVIAVPDRKAVKNRVHIDLQADGPTTSRELTRLLELGAVRTPMLPGPADRAGRGRIGL